MICLSTIVEELVDMSPKECTLLIPVRTSTCVPFHTAPIQHTSQVTATTAIVGRLILLTYTHIHPKNQQFFMPKIHVFSSLWMAMPSMNAKHTLNNNQIGWWIDLSLGVYGLSLFIWPFATIYINLGIADRGDFWPIFLLMGIYWMH